MGYKMSVNAILRAATGYPECQRNTWHYADMAPCKEPFYAQVWTPVHGSRDDYSIPIRFSAFDIWNELKGEAWSGIKRM